MSACVVCLWCVRKETDKGRRETAYQHRQEETEQVDPERARTARIEQAEGQRGAVEQRIGDTRRGTILRVQENSDPGDTEDDCQDQVDRKSTRLNSSHIPLS